MQDSYATIGVLIKTLQFKFHFDEKHSKVKLDGWSFRALPETLFTSVQMRYIARDHPQMTSHITRHC